MGVLLVCEKCEDAAKAAPGKHDWAMLWSSFAEEQSVRSVPRAVDEHFERLRAEYLDWLAGLGDTHIRGRRIVEYFRVRRDFSMWWMSLLAEKSQWKSASLYQAFRLMAFDGLVRELGPGRVDRVVIDVSDRQARSALENWCRNNGIQWVAGCRKPAEGAATPAGIYRRLPWTLQGCLYLAYSILVRQSAAASSGARRCANGWPQFSFFSYFFNLDQSELERGRYRSRYWTGLREKFLGSGSCWNWLHLFVKSGEARSPAAAAALVANLDAGAQEGESHQLLDRRLGFRRLVSVVRDYMRVRRAAVALGDARDRFRLRNGSIDLWPLLSGDWMDSFFGKTAASNALYLNLFESAIGALPYQAKGFYLLENQAWERALIHSWRDAGNGLLVGVVHSTVNVCDLRHFFAPSEYRSRQPLSLPLPDAVAVNGEASRRHYLNGGFPEDRLVCVEGLRYLYLGRPGIGKRSVRMGEGRLRLLVLGDYLPDVTRRQMRLLSDAASSLPPGMEILVKSHPACPIHAREWPSLKLSLLEDPLDQLVDSYDVAFTSNVTAAAVDAYLSGKQVLSMLDPETFNMSPLRGFPGVKFVVTPEELASGLHPNREDARGTDRDEGMDGFFYTDPLLPGWGKLLSSDVSGSPV